jgi:hypothetical protein
MDEVENILDHYGLVLNFPLGALAHLQLARVRKLGGDTAGARLPTQDFLALWKDADSDISILEQAKAEHVAAGVPSRHAAISRLARSLVPYPR